MLGTHVLHDGRTLVVIGRNAEHKIVGIYLDDRAARTGRFVVLDECELGPVVGRDRDGRRREDVTNNESDELFERNKLIRQRLLSGQSTHVVGPEFGLSQPYVTRLAWDLGLVFVGDKQNGMWTEADGKDSATNTVYGQAAGIVAGLLAGKSRRELAARYHIAEHTVRAIAYREGLIYSGKNQNGKWIRVEEQDMNDQSKEAIITALVSGQSVLDVGRKFAQNIPTINRIAESAGLVLKRGENGTTRWTRPQQTQEAYDDLLVSDRERKAKEEEKQPTLAADLAQALRAEQPQPSIDRPSDPDLAASFDYLQEVARQRVKEKEIITQEREKARGYWEQVQSLERTQQEWRKAVATAKNEASHFESEVKRLSDELKKEISKTEAEKEKTEQIRSALHTEQQKTKELVDKIDRGLFRAQLERNRAIG